MNNFLKYLFFFVLIFTLYMLSSIIFPSDKAYYLSLTLPSFAPNPIFYAIIWPVLYALQTVFILLIYKNGMNKGTRKLTIYLCVNYVFLFLYAPMFFFLHNLYGSFVVTLLVLITEICLIIEGLKINRKTTILIIPVALFSLFATVLSAFIYILN